MFNRLIASWLVAVTILGLAMASPAAAQSLKDQLVGSWNLVSNTETYEDGSKYVWGPDAKGSLIIEVNGQFSLMVAVGGRTSAKGNPAENPAGRVIGYFGSYTVTDADKTLAFQIERATFPGWDGTTQKRIVSAIGPDQMTFQSAAPILSGKGPFTPVVVWSRVK